MIAIRENAQRALDLCTVLKLIVKIASCDTFLLRYSDIRLVSHVGTTLKAITGTV